MQQVAKTLTNLGHEITSRWIWGNHQIPEGSLAGDKLAKSVRFALEDYEDVLAADTVIVFTDPPRTQTRGGKHVELGIALGKDLDIYMVGNEMENIFYYLPHVKKFPTINALIHHFSELITIRQSETASGDFICNRHVYRDDLRWRCVRPKGHAGFCSEIFLTEDKGTIVV